MRDVVTTALVRAGAVPEDAAVQAATLLEGDLRGHPSHGIRRLPVLAGRVRRGLVRSPAAVRHEWVSPSFLRVHGDRGFGPVVAGGAVDAAAERAAETGVVVVGVRDANHLGMLAPYVERLADRGCVGIALSTSEALVHPWRSARALVGTNPIGVAVPTSREPLVLDMSTAAVSMGKVLDHAARGIPLPEGWAVDAAGHPTTDAVAASSGAISPFGGPKGYALGIAVELLVATLSGTALGTGVRGTLDVEHECTKGDVFVAVSLDRLGLRSVLPLVDAYLAEVRHSAADGSPVDVPGDRALRVRRENERAGVPVDAGSWRTALELAERSPT